MNLNKLKDIILPLEIWTNKEEFFESEDFEYFEYESSLLPELIPTLLSKHKEDLAKNVILNEDNINDFFYDKELINDLFIVISQIKKYDYELVIGDYVNYLNPATINHKEIFVNIHPKNVNTGFIKI